LPEQSPQPARDQGNARRNRGLLLSEEILFMFASGLLDARTILPAFVRGYNSSLVLIALVPAIWSGGRLLPRLFAAHLMRAKRRLKPWLLGAGLVCRLPMAATPVLLLVAPRAPAGLVLSVFFASLLLFALADSFAGVAWYAIVAKVLPPADRPRLFGGMMVGGAVMGLAAGLLAKVLFDHPRWPLPRRYGLLFAVAFAALALGYVLYLALVEPESEASAPDASRAGTLSEARRLLRGRGPFARLMRVQILLGLPALADGLYTPYALGGLHLPLDATGLFVAAGALGAGVGGLCLPPLARRRGSGAVVMAAAVACVLAPLAFALAGALPATPWLREGWCVASFVCQGVAVTALFMGIGDLVLGLAPPEEAPLFVGLANTVTGLLIPLPVLGGLLAQWLGTVPVLWLCVLPPLMGAAVLRGVRAPVPVPGREVGGDRAP
jgi:MFS family permease